MNATEEQAETKTGPLWHQRWLDFAQRMALHGFPGATEHRRQRLYQEVTDFIQVYADRPQPHWDGGGKGVDCIGDDFMEYFDEYNERRWDEYGWPSRSFVAHLACCIRAGLDLVGEPSAGVLGFTVGDLRRMYDGTVPDWIAEQFNCDLSKEADDESIWL